MTRPIRVLVVDDSPTMRRLIRATLERDPGLVVVGEAEDPHEARAAIKALDPDVITLDVEMPNMNGLDFLERLMRLRPTPVVMVSTLTQKGAEATLEALELGALDCVGKPATPDDPSFARLAAVVRQAAQARPRVRTAPSAPASPQDYRPGPRLVAIGASTGGVEALMQVISAYPADCPATVITQHMPANFTASFAQRLDRSCAARVMQAQDGMEIRPGLVLLAPGGSHHLVVRGRTGSLRAHLAASDLVSGHRPSVDVLFASVATSAGAAAVGVILTGMGRDGAQGLLAMRKAGARTIGQDEATSVVFGMPRAADEIGAVERQLPLSRIGPAILASAALQPAGAQ